MDTISIRGARTHNLKNIDLDLPRNSLIVITGLSGSGKSSLAFDTIYAEGQRRYVESLSAYARQFLSIMEKPDVDHIEGLSPAISIEQKSTSHNPRSTVGTITEIYDYLRLLYARAGTPCCPTHGISLEAQTISQMVDHVLEQEQDERWILLAPVVNERKGEHIQLLEDLQAQGFIRVRIDGVVHELDALPEIDGKKKHTIEVIIDRFKVRPDMSLRLAESFETALRIAGGIATAISMDDPKKQLVFSEKYACSECGYSITELEPRIFSFNNPKGACSACDGLGVKQHFDPDLVVHNKELSLAAGAVRGWDRRNAYYYQLICSLAQHYEFNPETPFNELNEDIQHIVLYGSGRKAIDFTFITADGKKRKKRHSFEGIIANMERRYQETESQVVRDELAKYQTNKSCASCHGSRLNTAARNVFIASKPLHAITSLPIRQALQFFQSLDLPGQRGQIAEKINIEIQQRLEFLVNVGLDYLSLDRSADTLSGGEAQRIRLASQIGAGLVGVMYVLDEPSIGLHQRDNDRLLKTLFRLRDLGNTVIVVEHDEDAIRAAQYVVDIGPGAGVHGGQIIAQGTPDEVINNELSITGQYLSGQLEISIPKQITARDEKHLITVRNAQGNNLKNIDVSFPVGLFTCVTGVSGSGKSTLINDTLYRYAARAINRASTLPAPCDGVDGLEQFDKIVDIDQSPIGRTPRSNPATYTGLFTPIRELFSATPESRSRGYTPGRFSFNVKGGRCESCKGDGVVKVEMHFLPDIFVHCDTCTGKRYNRETLEIRYKGKTINEVLDMTVEEAYIFFNPVPTLARKLQTLLDVGLSYITLGQNATTLSGGEAQRIKLAKELSKRDTGQTLYILDEPTTGLHFHDIQQLLNVLHTLRDHGNTIIVIEHNLDVIKTADWLIDIGPEGGNGGGMVIAEGSPEQVSHIEASHTGHYLKRFFTPIKKLN
ncbi:MAG: excinuclease ABC subunit UvrA [Methylococcaceae bacterium]|nr:excinuclease ABC subunit UvrA [Methylococcaceae bacterium]